MDYYIDYSSSFPSNSNPSMKLVVTTRDAELETSQTFF